MNKVNSTKNMKKKILSLCLIVSLMFALFGCASDWRYNKEWMLGKTSKQIQARYGEFDTHTKEVSEDGLYRDCKCGYYVNADAKQMIGGDPEPPVYLYIKFDVNGIAYDVFTMNLPGG